MAEKFVQYAGGMSRERFVQEAALRIVVALVAKPTMQEWSDVLDNENALDYAAKRIAKIAYEVALALDEQNGPDELPHGVRA